MESQIPTGQPGMRKAWVLRAFERQRSGLKLQAAVSRIDPERQAYYGQLIALIKRAQHSGARVILDSGCGTGESTRRRIGAGQWVLGIDKSMVRMSRGTHQGAGVPVWSSGLLPSNADMDAALDAGGLLARAEFCELVLLMLAKGCSVEQLDFMYPNPWPKSQHFGRRWYGHPIWPVALAVGHNVELRTNWEVYAQEFAYALGLWVPQPRGSGQCEAWAVDSQAALTAFEYKYTQAGHPLYRVVGRGGAGADLARRLGNTEQGHEDAATESI